MYYLGRSAMTDKNLRDYQIESAVTIFRTFAVDPAGPDDDPIVAGCRGDGIGEDGDHGGDRRPLADGSGDDDQPSIRTEHPSDQ